MIPSERLPFLLRQMRQAATEANQMVAGVAEDEFEHNVVLQRAVALTLLIVAETAVQVMTNVPEFVLEHPEIAWNDIRGVRKPDRAWIYYHEFACHL